jgi:LacI family transcriptional regulator
VIGFNDMPFIDRLRPPLTTVRFPHYQLGTEAAQLLLERIGEREAPVKILYLAPELIVRKSVAAPAGSAAQADEQDADQTAPLAAVPLRRAPSRRAGKTAQG